MVAHGIIASRMAPTSVGPRSSASGSVSASSSRERRARCTDRSDRAFPVRHQGELLGALAVAVPANEPLTPAGEKLIGGLASQAGLVLLADIAYAFLGSKDPLFVTTRGAAPPDPASTIRAVTHFWDAVVQARCETKLARSCW